MKQHKRILAMLGIMIAVVLLFAGCSQNRNQGTNAEEKQSTNPVTVDDQNAGKDKPTPTPMPATNDVDNEPVTIKIFSHVGLTPEEFKKMFEDPVKAKYPHIQLEWTTASKELSIDNLIVSGDLPDIFLAYNGDIPYYRSKDLLTDISPVAKKQNIDFSRFESVYLDALTSPEGELVGLPYKRNFEVMYYNKDIFDKFAVEYPTDGMTWENVLQMGKGLTRTEGGMEYLGLDSEGIRRISLPWGVSFVDPQTNKANVNNETWKKVFTLVKDIYSLETEMPKGDKGGGAIVPFYSKGNVAMLPTRNIIPLMAAQFEKTGSLPNFDLVQYPSFKELPNIAGFVDLHYMVLAKTSKHKDQAMQVMDVVTSPEVQLVSVRTFGNASTLKGKQFQEQLAADIPFMNGKNVTAIFKSTPAPAPELTPYRGEANQIMQAAFSEFLAGRDVNTVLREAEEKINQKISEIQGK